MKGKGQDKATSCVLIAVFSLSVDCLLWMFSLSVDFLLWMSFFSPLPPPGLEKAIGNDTSASRFMLLYATANRASYHLNW